MNNRTILIISSIIAIPIIFYIFQFSGRPLSSDPSHWAEFGDYIGGTLNPILSLAAFILLLRTLRQNDKALKQNDEALKLNAQELELTRIELSSAASAQIELASIERQKLEESRNLEREQRFLSYISTLQNSVKAEIQKKIFEDSLRYKPFSLEDIISNTINNSNTIIEETPNKDEIWFHILNVIERISLMYTSIKNTSALDNHPSRKLIIDQLLSKKTPYLKEIKDALKNLQCQDSHGVDVAYSKIEPKLTDEIEKLEQLIGI